VTSLLLLALLAAAPAADTTARALAAYREGRLDEAQALLTSALVREPRNATLRKLLADCLLRAGRPAEARAELERVLLDSPEDGDARESLRAALGAIQAPEQARQEKLLESREAAGLRLESQQKLHRAEELLVSSRRGEAQLVLADVVSRDPGFLPAAQRLAELYSSQSRFDAAVRLYLMLYEKEPSQPEWLLRAARNLQWADDPPAAIDAYQAYLKLRPNDDEARLSLADTMRQFGLCEYGLPLYEQLAQARPSHAPLQLAIALCHDQLGNGTLAIEAFSRVLELDPRNEVALAARKKRERDFVELPRRRAYAARERGDFATAASQLEAYVAQQPQSDDALRELAEVYAWSERFAEAERAYVDYLARVPDDDLALRALARVQSWSGRLAESRASYEKLIAWGKARPGDYEGLVNVLLWSDDLEAAEPYARRLLELEPGTPGAAKVLADLRTRQALRLRESAEKLEAERRFAEARAAYQQYLQDHGRDAQVELRLCELLSWAGEHAEAARAYRDYLAEHPDDLSARLGLANSLAWAGDPAAAEPQFKAVLEQRPDDPAALLGRAQALDAIGSDPFVVRAAYERALAADASSDAARLGLASARLRVAPALQLDQRAFTDSDGLRASTTEAGARVILPGAWSLTPFYRLRLYEQTLAIVGDGEPVAELNELVAERGGRYTGHGFGLRAKLGSGRLSGLAELGYTWYGEGQETPAAQAEVRLRTGGEGALALSWRHDDAITEVNRVASLAAGVSVELLQASADRTLGGRLRLFGAGGLAWYSSGSAPGHADAFAANRQYRASLGSALVVGPARIGYVFRQTSFDHRSPLYFSPSLYRVHLLQLAADGRPGRFSWGLDAQAGLAEIDGVGNEEWALLARAGYRVSPRTGFVVSGRLSRSSQGLVVQRPYDARALTLTLERLF
jgi:tetratricopeptide (TPR) repeat protein